MPEALAGCDIDWCKQATQVVQRKFGDVLLTNWKEKTKLQLYIRYGSSFQEEIQAIYRDFA